MESSAAVRGMRAVRAAVMRIAAASHRVNLCMELTSAPVKTCERGVCSMARGKYRNSKLETRNSGGSTGGLPPTGCSSESWTNPRPRVFCERVREQFDGKGFRQTLFLEECGSGPPCDLESLHRSEKIDVPVTLLGGRHGTDRKHPFSSGLLALMHCDGSLCQEGRDFAWRRCDVGSCRGSCQL